MHVWILPYTICSVSVRAARTGVELPLVSACVYQRLKRVEGQTQTDAYQAKVLSMQMRAFYGMLESQSKHRSAYRPWLPAAAAEHCPRLPCRARSRENAARPTGRRRGSSLRRSEEENATTSSMQMRAFQCVRERQSNVQYIMFSSQEYSG